MQRSRLRSLHRSTLARRWVVERTLARITRHRRTVRDYERLAAHHETIIYMTRRLARSRMSVRPGLHIPCLAGSLPAMTNAHEVVAAYWAAAEARDWNAFGALLADDVTYRGPQTKEQVRGRDAYIRFNVEGFRYDWHLTVQQIVGEGQHAASWIEFTGPEGTQPGLCFFDLADDGKIALITDFWPDPYELPASRAHLVERY